MPLHHAGSNAAPDGVTETLVRPGPKAAQSKDNNGRLPLHLACKKGITGNALTILLQVYARGAAARDEQEKLPEENQNTFGYCRIHLLSRQDLHCYLLKDITQQVVNLQRQGNSTTTRWCSVHASRDTPKDACCPSRPTREACQGTAMVTLRIFQSDRGPPDERTSSSTSREGAGDDEGIFRQMHRPNSKGDGTPELVCPQ
mmetsp:Transcript_31673/g.60484  ORF Transcript_31673/g.60484 Transcript_31673/m.60484 type:complete len:201 (+) Transcript_31673:582-1184(+)